MSLHEYLYSKTLDRYDPPFYALLFAMMRKADSDNVRIIGLLWPKKFEEFNARYNSRGGVLPEDKWPVDEHGLPAPLPDVPLEPEYVHINVSGEAFAKVARVENYIKAILERPNEEWSNAFHAERLRNLLVDYSDGV